MAGDFRSRILPDAVARWGPPGSSGMVTYPVWRGGKRLRLGATGLRRFWRSAHPSQPDPSAGSKNGGLEQRVREQTEELEELRVALAISRGEMNALATVKAKELEEVWAHAHKLDAALQRLNTIFWSTKYHADGLAVWDKDTTFLSDPAFVAAYRLGMNSGHKIGRESGSTDDIHIEWRVHVVCWAAWHATHLEGSFVECGVNTGIYSLAVCQFIDFNATGKNFFLFDT